MNKTINNLEELPIEELEEQDYLLVWDYSEGNTKKISIASIIEFVDMMNGNIKESNNYEM